MSGKKYQRDIFKLISRKFTDVAKDRKKDEKTNSTQTKERKLRQSKEGFHQTLSCQLLISGIYLHIHNMGLYCICSHTSTSLFVSKVFEY